MKARASDGKQWVRSRYHWEEVAARFEAVYALGIHEVLALRCVRFDDLVEYSRAFG